VYRETLYELGFEKYLILFEEHVNHRGTEASVMELLDTHDFKIKNSIRSTYNMRFLNGSAFLNHSFIIMAFLGSWKNMFDEKDKPIFFDRFEKNLNALSRNKGELKLTIPMLYLECVKK
jgi:arsenite methyltransferase